MAKNKYVRTKSAIVRRKKLNLPLIGLAIGLLLVLLLVLLEKRNTINLVGPDTPPSTTIETSDSDSETTPTQPTTTGQQANTEPVENKPQTTENTDSAKLRTPTGNFVSNHKPELESSWGLNQIDSVCNTTPGASCQISFEKDGVTRTLAAKKTDSSGAAYWSWTLQEVGLTEGTWRIKATATLGSQTTSAEDPTPMEVKQ